MKSQIKIHFADSGDGKGLQPIIAVKMEDSDDVRDNLLKTLFQSLGGQSSWLAVRFDHATHSTDSGSIQYITISPVRPDELEETMKIISDRLKQGSDVPNYNPAFSI